MIFTKVEANQFDKEFIKLGIKNDSITLGYYLLKDGCEAYGEFSEDCYLKMDEKTYHINDFAVKGKIYHFLLSNKNKTISPPINFYEKWASRDGVESYCNHHRFAPMPLVSIYFNRLDDFLIMVYKPLVTDQEYEVRARNELFNDVIREFYPDFIKEQAIQIARYKVVSELDPNDSIAALEAQVDLLSKVMFGILHKLSLDDQGSILSQYPFLVQLEEVLNQYNVTKVKSEENCIAEITSKKRQVRQLQSIYHQIKEANQ